MHSIWCFKNISSEEKNLVNLNIRSLDSCIGFYFIMSSYHNLVDIYNSTVLLKFLKNSHKVTLFGFFQVFNILKKTPLGVRLCDQLLPQQPTISEMSSGELNFALTVQSLLNHIQHPEYRQIVVEVLVFCHDSPDSLRYPCLYYAFVSLTWFSVLK